MGVVGGVEAETKAKSSSTRAYVQLPRYSKRNLFLQDPSLRTFLPILSAIYSPSLSTRPAAARPDVPALAHQIGPTATRTAVGHVPGAPTPNARGVQEHALATFMDTSANDDASGRISVAQSDQTGQRKELLRLQKSVANKVAPDNKRHQRLIND